MPWAPGHALADEPTAVLADIVVAGMNHFPNDDQKALLADIVADESQNQVAGDRR